MKTILIAAVIGLFGALAEPATAQESVVRRHRANYPTPLGATRALYEKATVELLRAIAAEVKGGLLKKPSGNNCRIAGEGKGPYSCDYICFANGQGFDVLRDSESAAAPTWQGPANIDPGMCELVTAPPPPPPPPPPPNEDPDPPPTGDVLAELRTIRLLIVQQNAEIVKLREALETALAQLQVEIAKGVKIRF